MPTPQKPLFTSLPLDKSGSPGNAWGLFGPNDQLGTLNLLTPQNTVEAAKEIKDGVRINTDWPLNAMEKPCFHRAPFKRQRIPLVESETINDELLTINTQSSTQWDGFRHVGSEKGKGKCFFNGCSIDEVESGGRNGIDAWVKNGGITGRGILLDYYHWATKQKQPISHFQTKSIPASTLEQIAKSQNLTIQPGDILFIRTGWTTAYTNLSQKEKLQLAEPDNTSLLGVESSEETLRWIWDKDLAAVAGDQPAFEAWPPQNWDFFLHEWLLAGWGMPIGELFDLEKLGEECARRNRWSFFFSSVPLHIPGGVASPPNGVAIF